MSYDTNPFPAEGANEYRVVVIPPMGYAYTAFVDGGLDTMQNVVNGFVEHIATGIGEPRDSRHEIDFWCNEEFVYTENMAFNRVLVYSNGHQQPIYGPLVVDACDGLTGESEGLTAAEALSILQTRYLSAPQLMHSRPFVVKVQCMVDATADALLPMLAKLPDDMKHCNGLPYDEEALAEVVRAPLHGRPEDMMVSDEWRVHMVYPGEAIAGGPSIYEGAQVGENDGLPLVEFWHLPADGDGKREGAFISQLPLLSLIDLDGPLMRRGGALGGVILGDEPAQVLDAHAAAVAAQFAKNAHEACVRNSARLNELASKAQLDGVAENLSKDVSGHAQRGKR